MSHFNQLNKSENKLRRALLSVGMVSMGFIAHTAWAEEAALPEVVVSDTTDKVRLAEKVSAGALGNLADIDTPFSTRTVNHEEIEDRQANSLAEVLKYDAAITAVSSSNGTHPATMAVRGLRLDDLNGYKIDGLANINRGTELPLEMFERVEVLKGLSGFMYGFGSPGGIVNYVTKRPTQESFFSADVGYSGNSVYKEHADAGGRFGGEDSQRFGYRVNLVHEDGDTNLESGSVKRTSAGLALDARITNDLVLKFDLISQNRETVGGTDIVTSTLYAVPTAISGTTRLNSKGAYNEVDYDLATLSLDYQINPDWSNSVSYRYSDSVRTYKKDQFYINSNSGNYRDRITSEFHGYNFTQLQDMIQGKFNTGPLQHEVVLGAMTQELTSESSVVTPKTYITGGTTTGNLYSPIISSAYSVNYSGGTYDDEVTKQNAVFASDTIKLSSKWSVLGGVRYTDYTDSAYTTSSALSLKYTAHATTPTVALMFKPLADTTIYTSYAEALEQGDKAPTGTVNANATFAPMESKQSELGVKTEQARWSASAALFRIERGAQYTNSANVYVQDGVNIYQGIELNSLAQVTSHLTIEASYMKLNSELTDTTASLEGKRAIGAADQQAAAQVTYLVPQINGLSLRAGARYIGDMALDASNVHILPSYSLYDAGLNYRTRIDGHMATFGLNVTNLADKKYWTFYQENYLNVGAPRTLSMNLKIDL
jgi:iron complex outermembrane recepter protein